MRHDISATLVHGVYEGHPGLYIYQLTSALANDGLFVNIVIDLSPQSFVVLELAWASSVISSITYSLASAPREQHHQTHRRRNLRARNGVALLSRIGLGISRLAPVNLLICSFPIHPKVDGCKYHPKFTKKGSISPPTAAYTFLHPFPQHHALSHAVSCGQESTLPRKTFSKYSPFSLLPLDFFFRPTTWFWQPRHKQSPLSPSYLPGRIDT